MGKNADGSACGTTNSIDPLANIFSQAKQVQKYHDNNTAHVSS